MFQEKPLQRRLALKLLDAARSEPHANNRYELLTISLNLATRDRDRQPAGAASTAVYMMSARGGVVAQCKGKGPTKRLAGRMMLPTAAWGVQFPSSAYGHNANINSPRLAGLSR